MLVALMLVSVTRSVAESVRRVGSGDGLEMRFNAEGAVTDLGINGRRLPLTSDRGGVYITDVRGGHRARLAAEELKGQSFTGRMKEMGLNGGVRYIGEDEFIRVRIDVEDTTGEDRPLTLSFCLPVEADGWRWDRDLRTSQTIQIEKEEFRLFPSNTKSGGTCFGAEQWASLLPFGALTDGKRLGLALATEANTPRLTRIELDETGFFSINFDLAVSARTARFPCRAHAELLLYRVDPQWGLRAAAKRYYSFYPDYFTTRWPADGGWLCAPPSHVHAGEVAPEVGFDPITLFSYRNRYSGPDPAERVPDVHVAPFLCGLFKFRADDLDDHFTYEQYRQLLDSLDKLRSMKNPRFNFGGKLAPAFLSTLRHSVLRDENGQPKVDPWSEKKDIPSWHFNPSPHLHNLEGQPGGPGTFYHHLTGYFDRSLQASPPGTGIYCDVLYWLCTQLDYNTDHWRDAAHPLVFHSRTQRVAQLSMFPFIEFFKALRQRYCSGPRPGFLFVNGAKQFVGGVAFPAMHIDVLGFEYGLKDDENYRRGAEMQLQYVRAIAYHKPTIHTANAGYSLSSLRSAMAGRDASWYSVYTLYGIPFVIRQAFCSPKLRADQAQYIRTYLPLANTLSAAGWEPITGATAETDQVWPERYGRGEDGPVYLAAYNDDSTPTATSLNIDLATLGLNAATCRVEPVLGEEQWKTRTAGSRIFATGEIGSKRLAILRLTADSTRQTFIHSACSS